EIGAFGQWPKEFRGRRRFQGIRFATFFSSPASRTGLRASAAATLLDSIESRLHSETLSAPNVRARARERPAPFTAAPQPPATVPRTARGPLTLRGCAAVRRRSRVDLRPRLLRPGRRGRRLAARRLLGGGELAAVLHDERARPLVREDLGQEARALAADHV